MNEFDELLNRFAVLAAAAPEPVGDAAPEDGGGAIPEMAPDETASTPVVAPESAQSTEEVAEPKPVALADTAVASAEDASAAGEEPGEPTEDQQLRAFQERLSERLGRSGEARQTKLGVQAGGRLWLVELSEAGEIVAVPPNFAVVPLTHSWLRGLVNLRGALHAVTDLADFLGEPPSVVGRESRLLVFASRLNLNSAVLVDRMLGLQDLAGMSMISDPDGAEAGEWVDAQDRHWYELSLQQLAVDERFLVAAR